MIYRILVDDRIYTFAQADSGDPVVVETRATVEGLFSRDEYGDAEYGTLGGPFGTLLPLSIDTSQLVAHEIANRRARFYFTERGWHDIGRRLAAAARQNGHVVKVIRRKNPDPSQIVYEDEMQVAILPRKRRPAPRPEAPGDEGGP